MYPIWMRLFCVLLCAPCVLLGRNTESWRSNYLHPDYFEGESQSKKVFPQPSDIEGFLMEIHREKDYAKLDDLTESFQKYLGAKEIPCSKVLGGKSSSIFFLEKKENDPFFKQFGQTMTWLLLNRQDHHVTIRPILADKKAYPFDPNLTLEMAPFQVQKGRQEWVVKDPDQAIIDGFHIHMDYLPGQEKAAGNLFEEFSSFVAEAGILYSNLDSYPEKSNGPHVRAGWEIKFEKCGSKVFDRYGLSMAWLMLNHREIPLYSHAKTWVFGENEERLISHLDYALYAGVAPLLDQWFFYQPKAENTGLYRWDSQLPMTRYPTAEESLAKQEEILQFWFGENPKEEFPYEKRAKWFAPQDPKRQSAFDQEICKRFQRDLVLAMIGAYDDWKSTAKGKMALLVLLDQFPRNIYRGTPQAFAYDEYAREIAREGLTKEEDRELSYAERLFFYVSLEHSEDPKDQVLATQLIAQLTDEVPQELHEDFQEHYRMAKLHKSAVDTFGRFPWRNPILKRVSSVEEEIYLSDPSNRL